MVLESNLTVTVAAVSRRLVLLADVKTELGISGSDDDTKLQRLIDVASEVLAGPEGLNREPWIQTYLEKVPGDGGIYLQLSRWPIIAKPTVTIGTGASPTTVTAADITVAGDQRDRLYMVNGWNYTEATNDSRVSTGRRDLDYNVTVEAGWVMPDKLTEWPADTAITLGDWYRPVTATDPDSELIYKCTTAGTTGSSEPTWATAVDETVTDNTVTWTAYPAKLPYRVQEAAMMLTIDYFRGGLSIPAGIKSEAFDGMRVEYLPDNARSVSGAVRSMVMGL